MVMGQIWGIWKRKYGKNWERRIRIYDRLVWTVMKYEVEAWGWKERDKIKGCMRDS